MAQYHFAVVGATGLVGRTFLKVMEEYHLPVGSLKLFASAKSVGKTLPYAGKEYPVEALKEGCFIGVDYALFSAGSEVSKIWGPIAVKEGATVIDNSSCWRMDEACALIVPEVNFEPITKPIRASSRIRTARPSNRFFLSNLWMTNSF
jgi:aspartate-semialdehyde dehydrogenase